jgi:hypothetical protein
VAKFVYIDESGTSRKQRYLFVVGAVVREEQVQHLADEMRKVAQTHLGFFLPQVFEFHGQEIWQGTHHWAGKAPADLIAAYEHALQLLNVCDIEISHACIDKARLHTKYNGAADDNAYRLALQFLLEKLDRNVGSLKVLVADEQREQELKAIAMVADMQQWGAGEVPGRPLTTVIDSLHFVRSHASPGVQMADLAAYVIQRRRLVQPEHHPDAEAAMARMMQLLWDHTPTWRDTWP